MTDGQGVTKPLPVADDLSRPFWAAASQGELHIQRCAQCRTYYHPPVAYCVACLSGELSFERVSGRARVHSFTEMSSGARHPAFAAIVPYLVGVVELAEQEGLLLYTNFPGARLSDLCIGDEAEVEFEEIAPGVALPQFRLSGAGRPEGGKAG